MIELSTDFAEWHEIDMMMPCGITDNSYLNGAKSMT